MTAEVCGGRFPDVAAIHPSCDAIEQLNRRAIISGYPDATFRPDEPVTRAQVIKMVAAAAGLAPESGPSYPDISAGDWFAGWVAVAHNSQLIGGSAYYRLWTDGDLKGTTPADRGNG